MHTTPSLWIRFRQPSALKEISTCPQREEEKKARRKEGNQEGKKCATAVEICQSCKSYAAPRGGSHREPCHRVADGGRPANTHLSDRGTPLCECCLLLQASMATEKCWVRNRYDMVSPHERSGAKQRELDSSCNSSTLAGTFARQLGWVFVGPCHPSVHGPPACVWSFA